MGRYDELETLISLRESGVLDEHEFAEHKARILDGALEGGPLSQISHQVRKPQVVIATLIVLGGIAAYLWLPSSLAIGDFLVSADERRCRADIRAKLINPESVEFFEFAPMTESAYLSKYGDYAREMFEGASSDADGAGLSGSFADGFQLSKRALIDSGVIKAVEAERLHLKNSSAEPFAFRIKATGKLGNLITSTEACAVANDSCSCVS